MSSIPAATSAPAERPDPRRSRQNRILFGLSLAVFLATRLIGLERFPIFFFCDEAVQTVQAARFVQNGFRDGSGHLFPTYFQNGDSFNLCLGVYAQILPREVFGQSIFVTRATQVLILLSAMIAIGLILRDFFKLRFWWVGVAVLSAMPGWFLFTRIAFELMLAVTAYVWFFWFYLRYRYGQPRAAYVALFFGALTFYAYNTFQPVIVVTALLLTAVDAPYHWRQRRTLVWTIPLLVVLVLPYARFFRDHPTEVERRLRGLDSYWTKPDLTLGQKIRTYGEHYLRGFSPRYWFFPEAPGELARHKMKGYAYLSRVALPFALTGILLCLLRIREPAHRALLVVLAAAPAGTALVALGITRAMTFVPVVALLVALASDALLTRAARFVRPVLLASAVFAGLTAVQGVMLADALKNGPTWYRDYGMYGMQWGARELFEAVRLYRQRSPRTTVLVTPVWTNGANDVAEFFLQGDTGVRMTNIDWFRHERRELPENTVFVMTEEEYAITARDKRFTDLQLEQTIVYPDGRPGFRFVRLRYAPDFEEVVAAEKETWRRLVADEVPIDGAVARVEHSVLDLGRIKDIFDGNPASLVRTEFANPAVIAVEFAAPRKLRGVRLKIGTMVLELKISGSGPAGPFTWTRTYEPLPPDPTVEEVFPEERDVSQIRVEIRDVHAGLPGKVHVRDVTFF